MKVSVILAHPDKKSFNHAIAKAVVAALSDNGHGVFFHDLYEEGFDPILPKEEIPKDARLGPEIKKYCSEISASDGIVVIHPNWWGQPPAILKGWIDRVFRHGVAYEFTPNDRGEGVPAGLLRAKAAIVFNTSNTHETRERLVFGDPLETIWKNCVFGLCGVRNVYRVIFRVVAASTQRQRKKWLEEASVVINQFFPGELK